MKATELRIGNIVRNPHASEDKPVTIENISDIQNGYLSREGTPLNEEWLKRFGFLKRPIAWDLPISNFPKNEYKAIAVNITQGVLLRCGELNDNRSDDSVIVLINTDVSGQLYVHQLQNLYFALTGKEATINPL